MVELAAALTVCLLLSLGIIDISRLYGTEESLVNAVHEGAKVAAEYYNSYPGNPSGLSNYVESQIAQEGLLNENQITNLQITLKTPSPVDYPGEQIVQVSFQYQFNFDGPWSLIPGLGNPYTLPAVTSAEATR
ncbi:MAG TPA: TadE family protein [Chloroflexota bacterium]|nr:TadE family protein [Chloroflexota bacterium]